MARLHPGLLVLLVGAASAPLPARQAAVVPGPPVTLAVPGRANATPWLAAQGAHVAVVWAATAASRSDIFVAMSADAGATFAPPVQVNTVAGEGRVNGEIPPRVALRARAGAAPDVVVAWNAKDQATGIKVARSVDGGATFSPPVPLQSPGAAGDRGWHALALDDEGVAHVLWLDHRGLAGPKAGHAHDAAADDGLAMAQKSSLYYAAYGASARPERALTPGVCYCCKSAVVALPGGTLVSAWRHVFPGNMRDMAFTVSRDRGRTFAPPARVSADGWAINGCPDDGPALAADPDARVHIVWPTVIPGAEPTGALFYSMWRDDGDVCAAQPGPYAREPQALASTGGGRGRGPGRSGVGRVAGGRAHGRLHRGRASA